MSFFASTVARTAIEGRFRMSFVNQNRNIENTPNMSFGSNGVDWVRSFWKNQLLVFRSIGGRNGTRGRDLHEVCRPKPKLRKRTKHELRVEQGGFGAFILEKSIASFFASTMARTALVGGFRTSFVDRNQSFENTPNMSFG
jgi:hypothetical protein